MEKIIDSKWDQFNKSSILYQRSCRSEIDPKK